MSYTKEVQIVPSPLKLCVDVHFHEARDFPIAIIYEESRTIAKVEVRTSGLIKKRPFAGTPSRREVLTRLAALFNVLNSII